MSIFYFTQFYKSVITTQSLKLWRVKRQKKCAESAFEFNPVRQHWLIWINPKSLGEKKIIQDGS